MKSLFVNHAKWPVCLVKFRHKSRSNFRDYVIILHVRAILDYFSGPLLIMREQTYITNSSSIYERSVHILQSFANFCMYNIWNSSLYGSTYPCHNTFLNTKANAWLSLLQIVLHQPYLSAYHHYQISLNKAWGCPMRGNFTLFGFSLLYSLSR